MLSRVDPKLLPSPRGEPAPPATKHAGSPRACGEEGDRQESCVQPGWGCAEACCREQERGEEDFGEEHFREEVAATRSTAKKICVEEDGVEEDAREEICSGKKHREEVTREEDGEEDAEDDRSLGLRP